MKRAMRRLVLVVLCVVASFAGRSVVCAETSPSKEERAVKAFPQFREDQVREFNKFAFSLRKQKLSREDFQKKIQEHTKTSLIPAFLEYKKTKQGAKAAEDIDKELILIAIQLAEDDKLVEQILQSQKDPKKSLELKLHAAMQYSESGNEKKAKDLIDAVMKESKTKFPEIYKQAETSLFLVAPEGLVFPEFPDWAKDIDGKPLRIADYKGKILLVDFWASWCGPCRQEAPNVVKAYKNFHGRGFEIVGISFDTFNDKFLGFMKKEKMTWRQYFDGLGWDNKVGKIYGIHAIPAVYLLDKEGKVITNNARGPRLEQILKKELGGGK